MEFTVEPLAFLPVAHALAVGRIAEEDAVLILQLQLLKQYLTEGDPPGQSCLLEMPLRQLQRLRIQIRARDRAEPVPVDELPAALPERGKVDFPESREGLERE